MISNDFKFSINYTFCLLGYLIAVGVIYQCAYWSVFNINMFEFISSFQVLQMCLLSVAPFFIMFLFMILYGILHGLTWYKEKNVCPVFYRDNFKGFLKHHIVDFGIMLFSSGLVIFAMFITSPTLLWVGIAGMAVIILKSSITENAQKLFPTIHPLKEALVFYLILLPIWVFCWGKYTANLIYEGRRYSYIESSELKIEDKTLIEGKLKYLGKLDKYVFFSYDDNKKTLIALEESIFPIRLNHSTAK